jgi:uncharacterized lipoprotein YehR (DUF1307 family)
MKMTKRLLTIVLAMGVLFGAFGCGNKSQAEERKSESPELQQQRQEKKGD